jgi:hypothetical protein
MSLLESEHGWSSVWESSTYHACIRVNNKDDFAHPDVPTGPLDVRVSLTNFVERVLIDGLFFDRINQV